MRDKVVFHGRRACFVLFEESRHGIGVAREEARGKRREGEDGGESKLGHVDGRVT